MSSGVRTPARPRRATPTPVAAQGSTGLIVGGRYQLQREERSAPQARLFRAIDRTSGAEVGLWLVRQSLPPDRLAHFATEAERAHRVIFDGIRPILDNGVDGERAYVIVPLSPGETLGQALRHGRRPEPEAVLDLIRELAQALAAVHRHGLCHGYLRPDDVLATGAGHIIDGVGLWAALGLLGADELFAGDARYLAPEVRDGTPPSPRADVYSLAVLGAELLDLPLDAPPLAACLAESPTDRAASPLAVPLALARALRGGLSTDDDGTEPRLRTEAEVLTFHPRATGTLMPGAPPRPVYPPPMPARGTPGFGMPMPPAVAAPLLAPAPMPPAVAVPMPMPMLPAVAVPLPMPLVRSRPVTDLPPPPAQPLTPLPQIVPEPPRGASARLVVLAAITTALVVGAAAVLGSTIAIDRAMTDLRAELRAQAPVAALATPEPRIVAVVPEAAPAPPAPPVPAPADPIPAVASSSCPSNMVAIPGLNACVDREEAAGSSGAPLVQVSLREAERTCASRGARLCTPIEWVEACRGPHRASYPYGNEFERGRCNSASGAIGKGSFPGCVSASGARDMAGNVSEWVADGGVRGGSALRSTDDRCSRARKRPEAGRAEDIGFRCCAGPE